MAATFDEYWPKVASRWDAAVRSIETRVQATTTIKKPLGPYILPTDVPVALLGERGAGKTALYRALQGESGETDISQDPESRRLTLRTPSGRVRSTFRVIPGQDLFDRPFLGEILDSHTGSAPRGIIHVVSAGYDWVWTPSDRRTVAEEIAGTVASRKSALATAYGKYRGLARARLQLRRQLRWAPEAARSALGILLNNANKDIEEVRDEIRQLRIEVSWPLDYHLRQHLLKQELATFRTMWQDYVASAWRNTYKTRPVWFILAVSKFDLWYEERDFWKDYYIPSAAPKSEFAAELVRFVSALGANRLQRLAVLPVAASFKPYAFHDAFDEHKPQLPPDAPSRLLAHFRNVIGEFCDD